MNAGSEDIQGAEQDSTIDPAGNAGPTPPVGEGEIASGAPDKAASTLFLDPAPGEPERTDEEIHLENRSADRGLSAYEPISEPGENHAENLPYAPGLPEAEVPVPPPASLHGAPLFSSSYYLEPGPITGIPDTATTIVNHNLAPDEQILTLIVTNERIESTWKRIETARTKVLQKIDSLPSGRALLDDIQAACNLILAGKENFEEAERALNEVEYRLLLSDRVRKSSYTIGSGLAVYEVVWFILAVLGMLLGAPWLFGYVEGLPSGAASPTWPAEAWSQDIVFTFNSMMWGVLGGVTGAIYALWRHISRDQDFDKQHSMWYLLSPVGGFVVGAFVFLVVRLGVFSLTAGQSTDITSPLIIYVLAWLAGYQQNVVYEMVKRLLGLFRVNSDTEVQGETKVSTR